MKKAIFKDAIVIILGTAAAAVAFDVFVYPNNFSPGGVSGLADALSNLLPLSVGQLSLILNLPLLIAAWRLLGIKQLSRTLAASVMLSIWLDVFAPVVPAYCGNPLLAAGLGGAVSGLGLGFLFLRGISTGGTDLLSILLVHRFPNMPVGRLLMLADAAVVGFAVFIYKNIEIALYSFIIIATSTKVIDTVINGANYAKVIYTVTENGDKVVDALNKYTDRGCTVFSCTGGYTGREKQMITTVTRQNVLSETLTIIKAADPQAFSFVVDAAEVHGEGFVRYRADISPEANKDN